MELKDEVLKQGGAITDLIFVDDEMVEKAMKENKSPKDLACIILQ